MLFRVLYVLQIPLSKWLLMQSCLQSRSMQFQEMLCRRSVALRAIPLELLRPHSLELGRWCRVIIFSPLSDRCYQRRLLRRRSLALYCSCWGPENDIRRLLMQPESEKRLILVSRIPSIWTCRYLMHNKLVHWWFVNQNVFRIRR